MPGSYELNYNLLAFLRKSAKTVFMNGPSIPSQTRAVVEVDGEQPYELSFSGGAIWAKKRAKNQK